MIRAATVPDVRRAPLIALSVAGVGWAACAAPVRELPAPPAPPPAAVAAAAPRVVEFRGMCDASGAVPLDDRRLLIADDEDNVLRAYDADAGGAPLWSRDVSASLGLPEKRSKKTGALKPAPETDIEAATRLGDLALWLTSHGRNRKGKHRPERLRLFATTAPADGGALEVVGTGTAHLLDALVGDPRYAAFDLATAAERAPKAEGGLNLEGMTARLDGAGVWIGFRSPTPGGLALIAALDNPAQVVRGAAPALGDPVRLDLGGRGVRALSAWRGAYLIVAGDHDGGKPSALYVWDGGATATELPGIIPDGLNPEAFFTPEGRDELLLLSDDGTVLVDGVACKELDDPARKAFRGAWVRIEPPRPR